MAFPVGRFQRDAGDGDTLVRAEEFRLGGEPGDGVADLLGVEVEIADAVLLGGNGDLQADRAGADDGDFALLLGERHGHMIAEENDE